MYAEDWVSQIEQEVRCQCEVVVCVNALQPFGQVLVAQVCFDTNLGQLLLYGLTKPLPFFTVGGDVMGDFQTDAVGLACQTRLVQQLVRTGDAVANGEINPFAEQASFLKIAADRTHGRFTKAEPHVVDGKLAINGIRNSLSNFWIVKGRLFGVDDHFNHGRDHFCTGGGHLNGGQGRKTFDVVVGDSAQTSHMGFTTL